jgi:hypothetical protein
MDFTGQAMMKLATGVFVAISYLPSAVFGEQDPSRRRSLRSTPARRPDRPRPLPAQKPLNRQPDQPAA